MRMLVLALLCACATVDQEEDTDNMADKEVEDGWPNHVYTAHGDLEAEGLDSRLKGCSTALAYQTWEYEGEAELTLVLTPGRTEYADKYHHVVRMIDGLELPWNVVIWDPYGQGRSGGVRAHITAWDDQFVCDLNTLIETQVDPGLPIALASHSMGGLITARWLQAHPGEVVAAVFSAPMLRLYFEGFTESGVCVVAAGGVARTSVAMKAAVTIMPELDGSDGWASNPSWCSVAT